MSLLLGSPEGDCGRLAGPDASVAPRAPPLDGRLRLAASRAADMRTGAPEDDLVGDGEPDEAPHSSSLGRGTRPDRETSGRRTTHSSQNQRRASDRIEQDLGALLADNRRRKRSRRSSSLARSNRSKAELNGEPQSRAARKEELDKQVSATSKPAPFDQFGSERERSSSLTSDYFSSNHNSPIVHKKGAGDQSKNPRSADRNRKSATIYENPAFGGDERELETAENKSHRRSVQMNASVERFEASIDGASQRRLVQKGAQGGNATLR